MRDIKDYTEKYAKEPFEDTMVEIRRRMVIEQCKKYKHENIIEIGCGLSPFFVDFIDYENMLIVEPGELFVNNAKNLAKELKKNIKIVPGFLEDNVEVVKNFQEHYDFIILSSVLHELDKPQKMLDAIYNLCNKNTVVHINVPNANSIHRLLALEAKMIEDVHERSVQMQQMQRRTTYDMELLKDEVAKAGFSVDDCGSYFLKPFTHSQMQKCMELGIINKDVITGLEKVIKYLPEYGAGIYVNVRKC